MLSALHPQVAWYGRGDISSTFASTYKITTPVELSLVGFLGKRKRKETD